MILRYTSAIIGLLLPAMLSAQSFQYSYDNAGNRVQRIYRLSIVASPDSLIQDSLVTALLALDDENRVYKGDTAQKSQGKDAVGREVGSLPVFAAFPNPFNSELNIRIENVEEATLNIYSASGALIKRSDLQEGVNKIALLSIQKGAYLAVITTATDKKYFNLIKQ